MSPLAKKLLIKPGMRLALMNAPDGYAQRLGTLPGGARVVTRPRSRVEFVQVFAGTRKALDEFVPKAVALLARDGLFWVSWPKKTSKISSDIDRDAIWKAIADTGLRPVASISVDDTWSALRFRPAELVRSKR